MDHVVCPVCHGDGTRARISKKAKFAHQRDKISAHAEGRPPPQPPAPILQPCPACQGSGLTRAQNEGEVSEDKWHGVHPVAIVGGGIGGCALALALQQRSIACVVYEKDRAFAERRQGYGLTMQQGARALRALGLSGDGRFGIHSKRHVVYTADGTPIGQWGRAVWGRDAEKKDAARSNAHIPRQELRHRLLSQLRPGTVQWGHKLVEYVDGPAGVQLTLEADGGTLSTVQASALVGCDGIFSAARRIKVGEVTAPLRYLGCLVVLGIAPTPRHDITDGKTVFQTSDAVTRLYAMPFTAARNEGNQGEVGDTDNGALPTEGADRIQVDAGGPFVDQTMWQLSFPMDEAAAAKLAREGPGALKGEALQRCGAWHEPVPQLLRRTPVELVSGYPVYDRRCISPQEMGQDGSRVTLLGDAAHPMSPFKGQGANQALLDAVLLARLLARNRRQVVAQQVEMWEVSETLREFEAAMMQRSAVKVRASAEAAQVLHSELVLQPGNCTRGHAARHAQTPNMPPLETGTDSPPESPHITLGTGRV